MSDDVAVSDEVADGGGQPAPAPQLPTGTMHPRTAVLLVAAFASVVLVAVTLLIPVPYAIVSVGPAINTLSSPGGKPLIAISGHPTYPTGSGALDLTTVRIFGGPGSKVTLWNLLSGWLDASVAVLPEGDVFPPDQTAAQNEQQNAQEMASSQESATAAALRALGYTLPEEVGIASLSPTAASAAVLRPKDVILAVAGVRTPDGDVLRTQLQKVTPGASVEVTVRRGGTVRTVRATTQRGPQGATVLGILIEPVFTFPFEVKIQIDNVGGPSAGTMFALGIIDRLTPGELTGGQQIAGTGTIDPDGTVGPIGGIRQKLIGARRSGARYFLAPTDDCAEVVGHIPAGLSVVRISTLAQARQAVEQIGSGRGVAGLPACG